jgi:integrase
MTNNHLIFTSKFIENLRFPTSSRSTKAFYYDLKTRGLAIYVTASGVKTFFVSRRVHGKPERIILGRSSEISLEQARDKALIINAQIADGHNPQEKKRAVRNDMTFGELWEMYLERHAKLNRSSWKHDADRHRLYLQCWKEKKLCYITSHMIRELHQDIGSEKGMVTANHVHALIRLMFNKAIEWGWDKPNPAYAVKRFKTPSRERFLGVTEMKTFLEALENEPSETIRDYIFISLFTGARRSNVQAMRWIDIDLAAAQWIIPMTKNGKPHIVTLAAPVVERLQKRKEKSESEFVFASKKSVSGHLENPRATWVLLLERAGIKNLTIHDLRRTFGSWQAAQGANSYIIGKTLGHTSQGATAIYARLDLNPVRQSVTNAVNAMLDIAQRQ